MNNDLRSINTIANFKRFCMTIGELPTSYLETMTYYEMLVWFTEYMKNTIIPTINNNGLAIQELQDKYIELKTFVDNYFDNLDVQEEINNKLDEMAESGELTDIIAQYLGLAGVLSFNTIADMKQATNLVNGSTCKTLGFHEINDRGGSYYKVRNITNQDTINECNIFALHNENLVAELIIDENEVNVKQLGAYGDGVHDDTVSINTTLLYSKNVYIPDGIYLITSSNTHEITGIDKSVQPQNNQTIILSKNATLKCKPINSSSSQVIIIYEKHDIKIKGGHIIGELQEHEDLTQEHSGHCIDIISSHNIVIENVECSYSWGDCICITGIDQGTSALNNSTNILINNCNLHHFQRDGISCIAASSIIIDNNYIHDAEGRASNSIPHGIDLESNFSDTNPVKNVKITNSIFENNIFAGASCDITIQSLSEDIIVDNVIVDKIYENGYEVLINNSKINEHLLCLGKGSINHCFINTISCLINNEIYVYNSTITKFIGDQNTPSKCYFNNCKLVGDGISSYILLVYNDTEIYINNCEIVLNTTNSLSTRPCKKMVIKNSNIINNTPNNSHGLSSAYEYIFINNVIDGNKLYDVHTTRPEDINVIISNNIFKTKPNFVLSGQNNTTGIFIVNNNTSLQSLNIKSTNELTNLYVNNNYYPNA